MTFLRLTRMSALFVLATASASQIALAIDVSVYTVKKGFEFTQADSNLPTLNSTNGYAFAAEVDMPANNTVTNASVQPPAGLPAQPLTLSASQNKMDYKKKYNTLTALNTHYPEGAYTLTIYGRTDGIRQPTLQLTGSSYPAGPHIANFSALQAVNANGYFAALWDPFPGGSAGDFV